MKTNIFIPKKIKVGFQNRDDTYTKKLAYVIYYDQKGKLRKETSWNGWRDDKIPDLDFDNEPTSGFVLNKKVGDYVSDWNHRQAYVRVYDPRDFEFEINIENLLYILENASSIKGKGLEGDFVYGWDGKDLILIPTDSPDYKEIAEFNEIVHQNNYIKVKDLKLGATYKSKSDEDWVYMGKFDYWDYKYNRGVREDINKGKYHYFVREGKYGLSVKALKSLGNSFIAIVSNECVENYAELFDKLECTTDYSPLDKSKDEYIRYTFEEFSNKVKNSQWWITCYNFEKRDFEIGKSYNNKNKYYYKDRNNWNGKEENTLEEIYNILQPMYKNEYLQNGKFYRRVN